MEDVRQLVQDEGREAKNLVAFHVSMDPSVCLGKPPGGAAGRRRACRGTTGGSARSASCGRDKRTELRARYWALLFGDLQRAIGEIYNTVEAHENLSECQEVILVLENYTRDFKALCEWFRLKWEYDNTPPPQRPRSLAWEIRKTDFVRLEPRKTSVRSSPSVSGKNSPSLSGRNTPSGKNSPNLSTGKVSPGSGKLSPRINSVTSPKSNLEFFSSKVNPKVTTKPEAKSGKDRLCEIKEKVVLNVDCKDKDGKVVSGPTKKLSIEIEEEISQQAKATIDKLNIMECAFIEKQLIENAIRNENMMNQDRDKDVQVASEKSGLKEVKNKVASPNVSPTKSEDNFADVSNDNSPKSNDDTQVLTESDENDKKVDFNETNSKSKSISIGTSTADFDKQTPKQPETCKDATKKDDVNKELQTDTKKEDSKKHEIKPINKPAYSQAAAKPKQVSSASKIESKTPIRTMQLARSRTVVEICPNTAVRTPKYFPKRNQTSKCSYPFNLTTGRTSLFDTNRPNLRRPALKPTSTTSIESRAKIDSKKLPQKRPTSALEINENTDKKDKLLKLEKLKDCDEYSSSETVVTQIDMSRIESTDSLMTLVAEDGHLADVTNSIEVLNVDGTKNDNEGWLTVKSRRLSRESKKQLKSHWSNRFNQPSATTSLPTLNMMESPKQDSKPVETETKLDRAKSEQPQTERKVEKAVKVNAKLKQEKSKSTSIIRQKSDVTGLKTRSARNKAFAKKEKNKDARRNHEPALIKNRLHSSLESLTGLSRSQERAEEAFDFDKWKADFISTFKYLDDDYIQNDQELLKTADPSEMSEIAEMTSQIEENERKISLALDFQSEVDQRKLCEEEDLLNRQILELQRVSDVDFDTETDDTETDAEIHCDDTHPPIPIKCPSPEPLGPLSASLEDQYESALAGMSWAERVDTLGVLEALVSRDPGRAQQLHAKLSQGIKRRGSLQDALRRLQQKQARAEKHRQELQTERTKKIQVLLARVEEVKIAKNQLIDEKRLRMEHRLQKAAENRDQHIKDIVRKAHDEEEKLREILFIKQLEAENRRHEFLEQCRSHTSRLREMRRDRLDKLERLAAREAAVGARRAALQAARQLRVAHLLETRRARHERLHAQQADTTRRRTSAAREKAESVKSRLSALAAAAELEADALRSRILNKHQATQLRLETHLQAIRSRATGPRTHTTSESHDQIQNDCEELNETESAALEKKERDKIKLVKKKARKLRQKMLSVGQEYEEITALEMTQTSQPSTPNNKLFKILNQINNVLTSLQQQNENRNDKKQNNKNDTDSLSLKSENVTEKKKSKKNKKAPSEEKQLPKQNSTEIIESVVSDNKNQNDIDKVHKNYIDKIHKNVNEQVHKNDTDKNETDFNKTNETPAKKSKSNKKKREKSDNSENLNNKNISDKMKLTKSPSVASSLSDMSKVSAKSDKKYTNIDWMYFEKIINELNRSMDKMDLKNSKDIPVHGIRTISQLLHFAVDRDESAIQVSAKCLTTSIQVICRLTASCAVAATAFINTNCCLHVAKLLALQMEKEQDLDKSETQLVKAAIECLHHSIDSVVYTTRLYENAKQEQTLEKEKLLLYSLRVRAFGLVSYICMSGCLSRQDCPSDVAGEMQSLITVCAKVCQQCDTDTGQERQSAITSLRTSLSTPLCGARAQLCSLLALDGDAASHSVGGITCMLRALAELDCKLVQDSFGSGRWPLEFRAVVAHLLSQHAPSDLHSATTPKPNNSTGKDSTQSISESIALDLIVLIGYVLVNNPSLQETLCENWTAIKTLCNLPANWIVSTHCDTILPTLAVLSQHPPAAAIIAKEMSLEMIEEYIESPEAESVKLVQLVKEARKKQNKKPT